MSDPNVPTFDHRDPNSPDFWDERFDRRFMPWDQAGVQEAFKAFAASRALHNVLIPGCGSAYEALYLAERSWTVRAIDFSPVAVATARAQLGAYGKNVEEADFFAYQPPFSPAWIYERAFLCALPKNRWADYAQRMADLLEPGALLAGFYFLGATPKGPPFGIERDELHALLTPHFELVDEREVRDSIPVFAGRERWMTWRRA
ncbi:methyltransferase domain-containing protein [Caballeronia sp. GAWG1-1]|uniref:methyltransferase domain-containing protein n=1 Tax=Caballeronia sp. GAWG1-1 TaxID=2921742 RepID=UPI0020277B57|nr:methyltransferase domain-containing protein [Caballeronia sp. GAWG1-1]